MGEKRATNPGTTSAKSPATAAGSSRRALLASASAAAVVGATGSLFGSQSASAADRSQAGSTGPKQAVTAPSGRSLVPTPESVIGWVPGADKKLATYEQIAAYFHQLAAASDRVRLYEIGKTTEGRPQLLAVISSKENLEDNNLARYKSIARRLAYARDLTDEQAHQLARQGKAIGWVSYGTHSNEVAAHQSAPLMAYRLATDESPDIRAIRDNVLTLIVPSINPDGQTYMAKWYRENVDQSWAMTLPDLYHKYAGHDDNRDLTMFNLDESRNVGNQLYHEWFPQVVIDNHQIAEFPARIFVPPYNNPVNPNVNPLIVRNSNLIGTAMAHRLESEGKVGTYSQNTYDTWTDGAMISTPRYHNMVGILMEVAHANPAPQTYDPKDFPATFRNGISTSEPSTFYPSPYKGGEWHLSDSCAYHVTAGLGMLEVLAEKSEEFLYDFYQMGRDAIRAGKDETYVLPADQDDFPTAVKFVNAIRRGGVEVEQATEKFTSDGRTYPAGSFLVRGAQAFRPSVRNMIHPQMYPDIRQYPGGPLQQPYDLAGYTIAIQMGLKVDKLNTKVQAGTKPVGWAKPLKGQVTGTAAVYALDPRVNDAFIAVNRLLAAGAKIERSSGAVSTDQGSWPAGTFLVTAGAGTRDKLTEIAGDLGLTVATVTGSPDDRSALKAPRIGLYQAWGSNNFDQGWTRYIFDTFEFPYTVLHDSDIRAGGLRKDFDVIHLPSLSFSEMRNGRRAGTLPEKYTGGLTAAGVDNLRQFAADGGVVVCNDAASNLPVQGFGVPATDVTSGKKATELSIPGSILKLNVDNTHPIGYGMPEHVGAFFVDSPAFTVSDDSKATTVARYPAESLLISGFILGESTVANCSAVIDAPIGKGRAVMLGFRTQHRSQAHGTFKLLFNSIYLGGTS